MGLNQKQQEAVDYLDGPLLVLAGPGTGKTQLLSSKVAHILNVTDALPENIMCLTFTEAGASNMRERLLSIVGPEANKVSIHTYHAFGSDILAKYKNYSDTFNRNLDEPIDGVTQYKIVNQIIDSLPARDILKTARINDVIATISEAKSARLTPDELLKIAEENIKDTEALNQRLSTILDEIIPRMKFEPCVAIYHAVDDVLKEFVSNEPIVKNIEREVNELARSLAKVIEEQEGSEKPKIGPLNKWRSDHFEKDSNNNWRLKNYIANKKLLSFTNVLKSYEKYLEENNLFDFADMIEESIRILGEDDGFRYTLQERYQYILLDEFQDTNPSQFELIRLLTNKENTFIMAVGDDDQAIYEFQGASASNLMDFKEEYDAKIVNLTENYRSTTEIVELSRKIADQIENSFAKTYNYNKVLTSARNDEILNGETDPQVIRHEFKAADSEYAWVAAKINELIEHGEKQSDISIITPQHKYILSLLPYLKAYDNINIAYEKRENILEDEYIHQLTTLARFIYEVSIGNNPAHMLLEILTFPFLQIPAIEAITALKSYYGDTRGALDYLRKSSSENMRIVACWLAEMVAKSFDTPLELFIDYLVGTAQLEVDLEERSSIVEEQTISDGDEAILAQQKNIHRVLFRSTFLSFYTGNERSFRTYNLYENLSILREHIRTHIKSEKPRLKDLIDFLDDYELAGAEILNKSPYQDSSNAVQIQTAYKSKGLQYKHVFIIATDNKNWGTSEGNRNQLTLPKNLEQIRHVGQTEDERLRLFFVAITRAEKTLTLTNSKTDFAGSTPKRLACLKEYEVNDTEVRSPLLKNEDVVEHYEELSEEKRTDNVEKHWFSSYQKLTPELRPILEKSVENLKMNATALTTFIDIAYDGPISFYNKYLIHSPSEPASSSVEFGNLVHATFEAVTNQKLSDDEAIKFYQNEVEKGDFTEDEKKELIERGEITVRESLKAFRDILLPSNPKIVPKAELNLYSENLSFNGIPITGKIDHININEETKEIEIYDFKTSSFKDKKWDSHPTLYKYALQLMFYKLMLNMSPTYSKYKVSCAHILFVSPSNKDLENSALDEDIALVHDKVYYFNDAEEKDFKDLLVAVYRHIKALDFIDEDAPLAVYADKERKIGDILEFCNLIKNS